MADFPALPLWTDAYLADTRHLNQAEHGAYLLLLMEAWRRPRCRLPDDDRLLARLSGSPTIEAWLVLKPAVMALWTLDARASEWHQKRLMKERKFVEKNRSQKRDAARKSWDKRKNSNAAASPPHVQPTPIPIPIPIPIDSESDTESLIQSHTTESDTRDRPSDSVQPDERALKPERQLRLVADNAQADPTKPTDRQLGECFEQHFWPHYPRKVGKPKARAKFIIKARKHTARAIVAGLRIHRQEWTEAGTDKGFIPHPTTWLNEERYLEDPDICRSGRLPEHERPMTEQAGVMGAGARVAARMRAQRAAAGGYDTSGGPA